MDLLADFANGVLVMTVTMLSLSVVTLFVQTRTWLVPFLLLILVIPASIIEYKFQRFVKKKQKTARLDRVRGILIASFGVCFSWWTFDVTLTFCAINALGIASELNPLGWPLGAVGGLIFFVPAFLFTYFLAFRMKHQHSMLAAIIITVLSLYIGFMNFIAAGQNFSLVLAYLAPPSLAVYVYAFALLLSTDIAYTVAFIRLTRLKLLRRPSPYAVAIALSCLALIVGIVQPAYNFISSHMQNGQPSFDLFRFFVAYAYSGIEIRNNGSATAYNVVIKYCFLRRLNASLPYQSPIWTGGGTMPEIKAGENGNLIISVGRYDMETAFPNTNVTDFGAQVTVSCTYEGSEIQASFELESLEIIPTT